MFNNASFKPSLSKRIHGLDELRGIAVLGVMIAHSEHLFSWVPRHEFIHFGVYGVNLFFVISGYLITQILIQSDNSKDFFSTFYIRRLFRIWPLMLLILGISFFLYPETSNLIRYNLTLLNNYYFAKTDLAMINTDIMWSLAVEEHVYIFLPFLVYFLKPSWRTLILCILFIISILFLTKVIPTPGGFYVGKTTHGRMYFILFGALFAQREVGAINNRILYSVLAIGLFLRMHFSSDHWRYTLYD